MNIVTRFIPAILAAVTLFVASQADATNSGVGSSDHRCLARMIHAEARGESTTGQIAVAEVAMNRAKSGRFPRSICAVVHQGGQFAISDNGASLGKAERVAADVISGRAPKVTNGAMYFHTSAVRPSWSKKFRRTATIGAHHFYAP